MPPAYVLPMDGVLPQLIAYKGAVVAGWFVLLFIVERWRPAESLPADLAAGRQVWRRLGRNAGLWLINAALSPLVVLPLTAGAAALGAGLRPEWWAGWPAVIGDILLLDLLIYWWHRFNHEAPLLWRFHRVHHLDRFLDSTSALRFHFGEVLLSALARAGAIMLLGVPFVSVLLFETLLLAATIFHHSNLRLPRRIEQHLSRVVITPSIHWVHHHARRSDTDSNYGTLFSFWDRLFGSRSPAVRYPAMAIGVEGEAEQPLPALLVRPFRRS